MWRMPNSLNFLHQIGIKYKFIQLVEKIDVGKVMILIHDIISTPINHDRFCPQTQSPIFFISPSTCPSMTEIYF